MWGARVETRDKRLHDVIGSNVCVERVATGFGFTEGPVWDKAKRVIFTPERPTNMAWGDDDLRTLYITAQASLYRVRLATQGHLTY